MDDQPLKVQVALLVQRVEMMENSLQETRVDIQDLVRAWKNAGFLMALIKWVVAAAVAYAAFKTSLKVVFDKVLP